VNQRAKHVAVTLCLMAMAAFAAWPVWQWLSVKAVKRSLHQRTQALVEKHPQLQPAWAIAMQDNTLTLAEAKVIVEAAGEKIESEQ
jgi:hypothetical protein